jgi:hypothetical protein
LRVGNRKVAFPFSPHVLLVHEDFLFKLFAGHMGTDPVPWSIDLAGRMGTDPVPWSWRRNQAYWAQGSTVIDFLDIYHLLYLILIMIK